MKSYFNQQEDDHSIHSVMYYFTRENLPVLTLATEFRSSIAGSLIPGPTICNTRSPTTALRLGGVDMNLVYINEPFKSIYSRLINASPKHTSKLLLLRCGQLDSWRS